MNELIEHHKSGRLAHAYVIEGACEAMLPDLTSFIEKELKVPVAGNPDVSVREFETLTIDDARTLKERAHKKAVSDLKIFVVGFETTTVEAQNALLKLFEEPPVHTHFFLILSSGEKLLPTLRSRVQVISKCEDKISAEQAKAFLNASAPKRLELIKDMVEHKDKAAAKAFLNELEYYVYEQNLKENAELLKEIQQLRSYLDGRSPSVKMILEHISLTSFHK